MIIQINATVCAALDHGQGRRNKMAGSDEEQREEWVREQEKQEIE